MNVNDQWMLERMQQMAANMAASSLPQTSQNSEAPKAEKGDSFKDMMDKAKDQKAEAPKKPETAQKAEPAQKPEQSQAAKAPVKANGKEVELTAQQAAMLAAGYAKLIPSPEGDYMLFVTAKDENGNLVFPLAALEDGNHAFQGMLVDDEAQWTMEPTGELVKALEQLLQENNDPRSVDAILSKLAHSEDGEPVEGKMEIVIKAPEMDQAGDQNEDANLDAQDMTASQPLFKDVEAAPVKVGENFQLDTQDADMEAKLADTIRFAAQQGLKQIEIKLSPENLGSLTVKLTQSADGTLQVVLHTSNAKAANLLNQHLDNLNAALQSYNQNGEVRVEVQRGEEGQQAQHQQADPDGHNQQQQQERQQRQDESHSGDFIQKLRLGLFGLDDMI